jgi:hypothetical protein
MSKNLKYTIWSTVFIEYINLTRIRLPHQENCQMDVLYKRQMKYNKQLLDEKSFSPPYMALFICYNTTKWHRRRY